MSLAREIGRMLIFLRISHFFNISRGDFKIKFYPTNVSLRLWEAMLRGKDVYKNDEKFLRAYLKPGDVFVDVGANIGLHTLIASVATGADGRVYSIEAHPETYKALCGNIKLNGFTNIKTYNAAIGEKQGAVLFSNKKQDDRNQVVFDNSGVKVKMNRLDDMGIDEPLISLLKVDVEGYEKFVFEGAGKFLKKVVCVYYESSGTHFQKFGYSCEDVNKILKDNGYDLFRFNGNELSRASMSGLSCETENIVALRDVDSFCIKTGFQLRHN